MRFYKYITFIAIFINLHIFAQDTKYGGAFLELGVGPRALGLGSAYVALADDGSGFYWNPGGTAFLSNIHVSLMYANLFNSLENHSFLGVSVPIFGGAVVSVGWIRLGVDDIPYYNDDNLGLSRGERIQTPFGPNGAALDNPSSGSFNFSNNAYFFGFSKLSRWNFELGWQYFALPIDIGYGINFKMLDIGLADNSASGVGIDAGVRISFGLNDLFADENLGKFNFGMSVQDIFNSRISWDTDSKQKDEIERQWKYGIAYQQPLNFMNSEVVFLLDGDTKYDGSTHTGFEIVYKKLVALRIGSNDGNFTTGAGIAYWKIKIDYAYQDHDLGNSHRVGASFIF